MSDYPFPLSPKQVEAYQQSNGFINIYCGAIRSGKTYVSLLRLLKLMKEAPPGALVIVGKNKDTIERNIIDALKEMWGNSVHYNRGTGTLTMFGRTLYCIGANDERSEHRIRGPTFSGAYADEITLLPEGFFKTLTGRLSRVGSKLIGTTNPDSPFHWLKRDYIDRGDIVGCKHFHFTMDDNPSLPSEYIIQKKAEYTGLWYRRFILGEWCLAEGAVYDFFDEYVHCIPGAPHFAKYYLVGADYGTTNPTAFVLLGFNDEYSPSLWIEKEYYHDTKEKGYQKTDAEFGDDLVDFIAGFPVKRIYLDPSAASFQVELKRRGLPVLEANNDVIDGIRSVATRLSVGDLKIALGCKHLIRELQSYAWDPKSAKTGQDKPLKQFDHACDALRYVVHSAYGHKHTLKELSEEEKRVEQWNRMNQRMSPWNTPKGTNIGKIIRPK